MYRTDISRSTIERELEDKKRKISEMQQTLDPRDIYRSRFPAVERTRGAGRARIGHFLFDK